MGKRSSYEHGTFSWADLATTDVDAAKRFYTELLDWSYDDRDTGGGGIYSMARIGDDEVAGIGGLPQEQVDQGVPPHWNNYVTIGSVDEVAGRVEGIGGQVLVTPFEVLDAGRMAVLQDPTGAIFSIWEPRSNIGATLVNEPGALTWNDLSTRDPEGAIAFYTELFGWDFEQVDTPGGPRYWVIQHEGASAGRNGGVREMAPEEPAPPNWMPYFVVASVDGAVETAKGASGQVAAGPMDLPAGRIAVLGDPTGAFFGVFEGETDD